jgi:glutamate-1-semialdehyde 2,1-aminomutase
MLVSLPNDSTSAAIISANGPYQIEENSNKIIDCCLEAGALLLGHQHPQILKAISETSLSISPNVQRWAAAIKALVPNIDRVKFTTSGTASSLMGMRMARAFTGKDKILKFNEHFHGWHDYACIKAGINTEAGVPKVINSTVISIVPKLELLEKTLKENDGIAAIILEPTGAHWGTLPLNNPEFLKSVEALCEQYGILLILDEAVTGFRIDKGGAIVRYGIDPDLVIYAKIVAGGMPGGAIAGKSDVFSVLENSSTDDFIEYHSTWCPHPLSAAAGATMLEHIYENDTIGYIQKYSDRLKRKINELFKSYKLKGHAYGVSPIVHIALESNCDCLGDNCTVSHDEISTFNSKQRIKIFMAEMQKNGVKMLFGGGLGFMLSEMHKESELNKIELAVDKTICYLMKSDFFDGK